MNARPGEEKIEDAAGFGDILQHLAAAGIDVEGDVGVGVPSLDDARHHQQIAVGGVDAGADDGLVDLDPGDLRAPA